MPCLLEMVFIKSPNKSRVEGKGQELIHSSTTPNHPGHRKEEGKHQESMQSSTTPDPGHLMGKLQKHKKHHIQESQ